MASAAPIDFAPMMKPVALRLLGEPNKALSNARTLRWGTNGSLKVDVGPGAFHDKEADTGGGVLGLIMREKHCDKRGALDWLEREGLIDPPAADTPVSRSVFYDYGDADGAIRYRVERRGKGHAPPFLQHGPDGHGGFHAAKGCMQGVARLPYRLPELLAADPAAIVFVVEGEKDADRLAAAGLIATTNSEGAGKFRTELAPYFAGRRVVIIPDNDKPGREHAADVAAKLSGIATAVAVLTLPGLRDKGDVSDWLDSGSGAFRSSSFDLHLLAEAALAALDVPAATFALADLSLWANTAPTPKAFVMAPFIPRDDVVIVTGDGGTNKSTLALQISACAAAGKQMLGMNVAPGPALYITAEDDNRENHWRLAKIAATIGTTLHDLAGRLHIVSLRGRLNNELATFDADGKLRLAPAYALLRATIEETKAKLVTLDNVAHLFAGNENDRGQVTAFINLLYQLCGELGVTILLIAHRNKNGDTYSGSTAWLNAVRSQILLERLEGDPDVRRLTLGKANYARQGDELPFRWHDFALVRDEDLSADVREQLAATAAASADNGAFLECLRERERQGDGRQVGPAPGPNYAPAQFEGMPQARGATRERLKTAMDRLFAIGAIESHTYRNTSKGRDVTALREVSRTTPNTPERHPEPFPNASRTDPRTPPERPPNHPAHTPPYYVGEGGGLGATPPAYPDADQPRRHGGSILAPGETPDDPVPGWSL